MKEFLDFKIHTFCMILELYDLILADTGCLGIGLLITDKNKKCRNSWDEMLQD